MPSGVDEPPIERRVAGEAPLGALTPDLRARIYRQMLWLRQPEGFPPFIGVPGRRDPSLSTIDNGTFSPEPKSATASSILRIRSSVAFAGRKM